MENTIEQFYKKYTLEYNQVLLKNKPANVKPEDMCSEGGCMYETYGDEYKYIESAAQTDLYRVWTLIDNNDGWYGVVAGWHWANRIGYLITKEPWQSEDEQYTIYDNSELREQWENLPISIIQDLCTKEGSIVNVESLSEWEQEDYIADMFYIWEEMSEEERDKILKKIKDNE